MLDILQEKGAVNTVFLTTFTYGRGLSGRQIAGQPYPDHGKQEPTPPFIMAATTPRPTRSFTRIPRSIRHAPRTTATWTLLPPSCLPRANAA